MAFDSTGQHIQSDMLIFDFGHPTVTRVETNAAILCGLVLNDWDDAQSYLPRGNQGLLAY